MRFNLIFWASFVSVQRSRLAQGAGFKLNAGGKSIAAILKFGFELVQKMRQWLQRSVSRVMNNGDMLKFALMRQDKL